MKLTILTATLLPLLLAGCLSGGGASGGVNGIEFRMALDRPTVDGGDEHSIDLRMHPGEADRGRLFVDGVDFGEVVRGDHVRVTREAVVLVNGEPRAPVADG